MTGTCPECGTATEPGHFGDDHHLILGAPNEPAERRQKVGTREVPGVRLEGVEDPEVEGTPGAIVSPRRR